MALVILGGCAVAIFLNRIIRGADDPGYWVVRNAIVFCGIVAMSMCWLIPTATACVIFSAGFAGSLRSILGRPICSFLFAILVVTLFGWGRSTLNHDTMTFLVTKSSSLMLNSRVGRLSLGVSRDSPFQPPTGRLHIDSHSANQCSTRRPPTFLGFGAYRRTFGERAQEAGLVAPYWFVSLILSGLFLAFARNPFRELKANKLNRCVQCYYDLHGNVSAVCPECGTPVDQKGTVKIFSQLGV